MWDWESRKEVNRALCLFQIWVSGFLSDMWTTLSMEAKTSLGALRSSMQVSKPGRVSSAVLHKLKCTVSTRIGQCGPHRVFLMTPSYVLQALSTY